MSDAPSFATVEEFIAHLRQLRFTRLADKAGVDNPPRRQLTATERQVILEKTGGRCHLCGGKIDGAWTANHIHAHTLAGDCSLANYLPSHPACNRSRWFYGDMEFQWILKLGVFFRTHLEELGNDHALELAQGFLNQEAKNCVRRKYRARNRAT
jgi:hypothetical protein